MITKIKLPIDDKVLEKRRQWVLITLKTSYLTVQRSPTRDDLDAYFEAIRLGPSGYDSSAIAELQYKILAVWDDTLSVPEAERVSRFLIDLPDFVIELPDFVIEGGDDEDQDVGVYF